MTTQSGAGTGADTASGVEDAPGSRPPTTPTPVEPPTDTAGLAPFAWRRVGPVAAVLGLLLLVTSGGYGYQGDELYFLGAGGHPAWSYADNPPLMPWLATLMDSVSGGSLVALRLPSTLLTAGGVLLVALLARELGGGRRAQFRAALIWAAVPLTPIVGHALSGTTIDVVAWTAISWVLVAWVRRHDDRLLVVAVLATAVAVQAKYSVVFLWLAVAVTVLVLGPRRLLVRPVLLGGGVLVAATLIPGLAWQAANGWPQLEMTAVFAAESTGPVGFLGTFVYLVGVLLAVPLLYGLWVLVRSPELRPYRFLGWSFVLLTALFLLQGGRPTYMAGLFGLLWAAAAVAMERRPVARWWGWTASWPVIALVALVAIGNHLPVVPAAYAMPAAGGPNNPQAAETLGWPDLVAATRRAYDAVPPAERASTVVVAQYYTSAGALDHAGAAAGLPPVHSDHRGYWYFGAPPDTTTTTIYVGTDADRMRRIYTDVREVARAAPGPGSVAGTPVFLCTGPRVAWSAAWPTMGHLL